MKSLRNKKRTRNSRRRLNLQTLERRELKAADTATWIGDLLQEAPSVRDKSVVEVGSDSEEVLEDISRFF
jgi:hypothetical protein